MTGVAQKLEAVFGEIARTRMAGMPIVNPALRVEAVGFREGEARWAGAYELMGLNDPVIGACHTCPLISPVMEFATHERVIARLVDLLDSAEVLADENFTGRVQSVPASDAADLSEVRTACGMLMHYVRIETERTAEYLTVALTE